MKIWLVKASYTKIGFFDKIIVIADNKERAEQLAHNESVKLWNNATEYPEDGWQLWNAVEVYLDNEKIVFESYLDG